MFKIELKLLNSTECMVLSYELYACVTMNTIIS